MFPRFHTVGCKPLSVSSNFHTSAFIFPQSNSSVAIGNESLSVMNQQRLGGNSSEPVCMRTPTVFRDEQDVLSLRFIVSSNLNVTSDIPTVLTLDLDSTADSGGTFVVQLLLNTVSIYVHVISNSFKLYIVMLHIVSCDCDRVLWLVDLEASKHASPLKLP